MRFDVICVARDSNYASVQPTLVVSAVANPSLSEGLPTAVNGDLFIAHSSQKCFGMCWRLFECDLTSFASPGTRIMLLFSQP